MMKGGDGFGTSGFGVAKVWATSSKQPKLRNDGVEARSEWEGNGWEDLVGTGKSGRAKAKRASEWTGWDGRRNERGGGGEGGAGLFGWPGRKDGRLTSGMRWGGE